MKIVKKSRTCMIIGSLVLKIRVRKFSNPCCQDQFTFYATISNNRKRENNFYFFLIFFYKKVSEIIDQIMIIWENQSISFFNMIQIQKFQKIAPFYFTKSVNTIPGFYLARNFSNH